MNLIQLSGIGDAISGSLSSVWENISDSIWTKLIEWLYESIYGAVADFFTMISGMGADIFDLSWVKATTKLFSLFGWSMFVSGLVVGVFEMAMEYQMQGRINVKRQILPMLYGLMAVSLFTTVPICTDACESFDANKLYLTARIEGEENRKVAELLEADREFLDDIQIQMSTAREFAFVVRLRNESDEQGFATLNRIEKLVNEQGFDCRRAEKDDLKRILSRYFGQIHVETPIADVDGGHTVEKWIIED